MSKQEFLKAIEKMPDELFIDSDEAVNLFSSFMMKKNVSIIEKLDESLKYNSDDCIDLDTLDKEIRSIISE